MESKHLTNEQIAVCAENLSKDSYSELSPEIREHVKSCNKCAQDILILSEIIKDIEEEEKPTSLVKSNKKQWIFLAASIAIIFSTSYYVYTVIDHSHKIADTGNENSKNNYELNLKDNNQVNSTYVESDNDTLNKNLSTTQQNNIVLAYTPNKDLEKLAKRYLNGSLRGTEIKINTPNEISAKAGEIRLEWTNNSNQFLILEFFNNKGEKLFEAETVESKFTTSNIDSKGLYYWKLLNEDFDLLFCGKIKVD